jgi:CRISPR/Cas system CSM-associated protein Csm2 small subunit
MRARKEAGNQERSRGTPEQMAKMKAQREELMKLGEAARNETDPAQKEALVSQLRAKLTEVGDKMQAEGKKRLEHAEAELAKLKEKLAEAEQKKSARIEEQVQRILAGEPLRGADGKRPDGASKKEKEGKKGQNAPVAE